MKFSVIMPTLNAEGTIGKNLKLLQKQSDLLEEIIVLDNESNDNTKEIAKKYNTKIINIPRKDFDHGATRNLGAKEATGDILLYISGDVVLVNSNLLSVFGKAFQDKKVGGAYARQLPREDAVPIEKIWRKFAYKEKSMINTYESLKKSGVQGLMFSTACAAIRKDIFDKLNGFESRIIRNEDMLMAWRIMKAGYKTKYLPKAVVRHSHDYSLKHSFQQYFDIGVFFAHYSEILAQCGNTGEGFERTLKGAKILLRNGLFYLIPKLFLESFVKLLGYTAGKNFDKLPKGARRAFSKNKNYWDNQTS